MLLLPYKIGIYINIIQLKNHVFYIFRVIKKVYKTF